MLGACGSPPQAPASSGLRVIRVVASNFGYQPDRIHITRGEVVRFVLENPTELPHELFIGSEADQAAHARHHREAGGGQGALAVEGPAAVYVPPGGTGQLEHHFDTAGELIIGCHLVGHWEAGMRATITVDADSGQ